MKIYVMAIGLLSASALAIPGACTSSPVVSGTCTPDDQPCQDDAECCSNVCSDTNTCLPPTTQCVEDYQSCTDSTECCSLACSGGVCDPSTCTPLGEACTSDNECCDMDYCDNDVCASCVTSGNPCGFDADCCSGNCVSDVCE
jgi:hypothetical protein